MFNATAAVQVAAPWGVVTVLILVAQVERLKAVQMAAPQGVATILAVQVEHPKAVVAAAFSGEDKRSSFRELYFRWRTCTVHMRYRTDAAPPLHILVLHLHLLTFQQEAHLRHQ
ncbi:MAG TPA: hypothetical protein VL122_00485 [Nitrospirota bacterium]|nr:hypothetical protein [Nitrospirota bacterium]